MMFLKFPHSVAPHIFECARPNVQIMADTLRVVSGSGALFEYFQVIMGAQQGMAVQPFYFRAFLLDMLDCAFFEIFDGCR